MFYCFENVRTFVVGGREFHLKCVFHFPLQIWFCIECVFHVALQILMAKESVFDFAKQVLFAIWMCVLLWVPSFICHWMCFSVGSKFYLPLHFLPQIFAAVECVFCPQLFTCLLTPWSRVLLEKLTGLQLVKKFLTFYGTRRFITAVRSARHLSLSWASSIQSVPPHPTSLKFKFDFIYSVLLNFLYKLYLLYSLGFPWELRSSGLLRSEWW